MLSTRVMSIQNFTQPAPRYVRIHLSGGDVGMTQHDLHTAQVRSSFHQVGGETMPDHMRRQTSKNARLTAITFEQLPKTLTRHGRATRRNENIFGRPSL